MSEALDERGVAQSYSIDVTATAKSKAFRMHKAHEIERIIRGLRGTLWKRATGPGDQDEYHLISSRNYAIVLYVDHRQQTITVPTQMHRHIHYQSDQHFERVGEIDRGEA